MIWWYTHVHWSLCPHITRRCCFYKIKFHFLGLKTSQLVSCKSLFYSASGENHEGNNWTHVKLLTFVTSQQTKLCVPYKQLRIEIPMKIPCLFTQLEFHYGYAQGQEKYLPVFKSICLHQRSCSRHAGVTWTRVFFEIIFGPKVAQLPPHFYWLSFWTRLKPNKLR